MWTLNKLDSAEVYFHKAIETTRESDLTDYDRFLKFAQWGIERSEEEEGTFAQLKSKLRSRGIHVGSGVNPLQEVDDHFGSFAYRKIVNRQWRLIQAIHFPGINAVRRDVGKQAEEARLEKERRESALGAEPSES